MTWAFWLTGAGIVGIAIVGLWRFFNDPVKVARLIEFVASQAFKMALAEILKPETPEAREKRIEAFKRDEEPATKFRKHPDEGGHR